MERHRFTVDPESAGTRLDVYLAGRLPQHSRSQLQRVVKDGGVTLGGKRAKPNATVKGGDIVEIGVPDATPATPVAQDIELPVIYQDADVIVVNKPAGLVVHPAAGHAAGTLVNALLFHADDLAVSGASGGRASFTGSTRIPAAPWWWRRMNRPPGLRGQFQERPDRKEYLAVVGAVPGSGTSNAHRTDPHDREKMSRRSSGRTAVTHYRVAESWDAISLLRVRIETGRTHQIRVHLAHIGHPIVGDRTYGGVRHRMPGALRAIERLERPFLHAARLAFTHPREGTRLEFTCPLPPDLQGVLEEIEARFEETRDDSV